MTTFVIVGVISGVLFGVMDAAINVSPLARRLFEAYRPIARTSVNPFAGIFIDVVYGLAMAGIYLLLYESLPGASGLIKGLSFAAICWFFRVVMSAASHWMMFTVPVPTLLYSVVTGLGEMVVLGVLYGLTLKPWV